jgi:hypothetical protein
MTIITLRVAFCLSLLGWLMSACGPSTPPYARLPESFLNAVQTGELTSIEDVRGLPAFTSGSAKKFGISFQADDKAFEFPAASIIGKITGFKLLSDEPFDYKLDGQKQEGAGICSAMEQIVSLDAEKPSNDGPLEFGESRYLRFHRSVVEGNCGWDEVRGMRQLTYAVETTRDFVKVSFIVDRESIWMIDLHK